MYVKGDVLRPDGRGLRPGDLKLNAHAAFSEAGLGLRPAVNQRAARRMIEAARERATPARLKHVRRTPWLLASSVHSIGSPPPLLSTPSATEPRR